MSHCVISAVVEADDPLLPVHGACVVHTHYAPCPHNGEPASPIPLHADTTPSREEAIERWVRTTHRQRPLVLHRGSWADGRDHEIEIDSDDCWCGPEKFPAEVASS